MSPLIFARIGERRVKQKEKFIEVDRKREWFGGKVVKVWLG